MDDFAQVSKNIAENPAEEMPKASLPEIRGARKWIERRGYQDTSPRTFANFTKVLNHLLNEENRKHNPNAPDVKIGWTAAWPMLVEALTLVDSMPSAPSTGETNDAK